MHRELVVKTPSLSGSSELLVIAPIKSGFVPALDAVTYTSRARLLLRLLHAGRKNAHEYNVFRAVSDAVERVGVIQTLRVAVLEPDTANPAGSILLSVNFDGAYEAYVRTIWQKSARLLDLIFCNTIDHVTGWDHSYTAWSTWLASRQIDTPFYYGTPSMTKGDITALRMQDRFQRRTESTELLLAQMAIADAEHIAWELIGNNRDPQSGPFAEAPNKAIAPGEREGVRQGLQGLAGVFRLTDLYTPGTDDGEVLHRAAHELLPELVRMWGSRYADNIENANDGRLDDALRWLMEPHPVPPVRQRPALPTAMPSLPAAAQAGILRPIADARRACICLVSFDHPAAAAAFLREFTPTPAGTSAAGAKTPVQTTAVNVTLTFEGLRACGVPESVLDRLPIEFKQGMQRRAGVLGDVQGNHPRRWSLPVLNWPAAMKHPKRPMPAGAPAVPLDAVHALLHVRAVALSEAALARDLLPRLSGLEQAGVRPLSVQWLERNFSKTGDTIDHFGYADGASDPAFAPDDAFLYPNQVHLGEALVGHANAADAAPELDPDLAPLLKDASYLVVRKLRQDVDAFEAAVKSAQLPPDLVKAKLMGRWPDGTPLVPSNGLNDFNYDADLLGSACPFAAHIRRANPRVSDGVQTNQVQTVPGARPPRLFRRGMSYTESVGGAVEKGLFFMAFNASIGEQFEVVQRWLSGGNSSGAASGATDAICGVAEAGRRRFARFEEDGTVHRLALDGDDELGVETPQLVRLAWGSYFLAPSLDGIAHLITLADAAARPSPLAATPVPWRVDEGFAEIERLQRLQAQAGDKVALEHWKAVLEDPESRRLYRTASVWAAIRDPQHGGVLRTPYGVLVADEGLVNQVLTDVDRHYSVCKYQERLAPTIGEIFLGLDPGPEYELQASACNRAIEAITFDDGYSRARTHTTKLLADWIAHADTHARAYGESRWRLDFDIRDVNERVLGRLLEDWFGLAKGDGLTPDGFDWAFSADQPARYPGAFYTPSRYTFQPQPSDKVREIAERDGQHLRTHMAAFLQKRDSTIQGKVTRAVLDDPAFVLPDGSTDYDLAARTLAGAIMGFVPTTDHNLRRIVEEWLRDQTLWSLRARTVAGSLARPQDGKTALSESIRRTMMLRPMPEFVWRTAVKDQQLRNTRGDAFAVRADERVVLGLVSATQQKLEHGKRDVTPIFGGDRWAQPAAPRHACPGMHSAMGVIAGVLSAILDSPFALRPSTASGVLSFEGPVTDTPLRAPGAGDRSRVLLGWGDSWLHLNHPLAPKEGWDLARSLAKLGWDTEAFALYSTEGMTLQEMAYVARRTGFYRTVFSRKLQGRAPAAILIDGGGNDVHHNDASGTSALRRMAAPPGSTPPLIASEVQAFVHTRLKADLTTVLTNLVDVTDGAIPIFVHGYDHPIPNGIGFGGPLLNIPWLDPVNGRPYSPQQGAEIMRLLIDELNAMIAAVVQSFAAKGAHHLNLTGTLAAQPGFSIAHCGTWWLNELHPTQRGYDLLAAVADAKIAAVLAASRAGSAP